MVRQLDFVEFLDPDVYMDVDGLSNPFEVGIPLGISNTDTITLYFRISIPSGPAGYTNYDDQLGSIAAASNAFFLWKFDRATPSLSAGELDEALAVRLYIYTDAGYSVPYGTAYQDLTVTFHWFDSSDVAWTVIDTDNFDGGTTDGWAGENGQFESSFTGYGATPAVSVTHYISSPNGLIIGGSSGWYVRKQFNTTGYSKCRVIIHNYVTSGKFAFQMDSVVVLLGAIADLLAKNVWKRMSFNAPANKSWYFDMQTSVQNAMWLDNIKVIGKV